jgi:hypothetical protein
MGGIRLGNVTFGNGSSTRTLQQPRRVKINHRGGQPTSGAWRSGKDILEPLQRRGTRTARIYPDAQEATGRYVEDRSRSGRGRVRVGIARGAGSRPTRRRSSTSPSRA